MSVVTAIVRAPRKVFYGWWIVLAAAAMNVYGSGVWFYGFPVFFPRIIESFGWTRAMTAGAFSISRVEGGLEAPIIGYLVDRFGPRKLALAGAVTAGCGFMLMSWVNDFSLGPLNVSALVAFYLVFGGVLSIGYNTGFGHTATPTIANWFIRKRSRAFALWSLGAGGSGIVVALLQELIAAYGWRQAAFLCGLGMFVVVVPLAAVLRHRPEQYGQLPDGERPEEDRTATAVTSAVAVGADRVAPKEEEADLRYGAPRANVRFGEYDFSVREALATASFWFLYLGSMARAVTMTAVVIHEVAYLEDIGFSSEVAARALAAMVFISLIGRFCFGWLGDAFEKRKIFIATMLLQILGLIILDQVRTMTQLWVFVVVYAIGYGGAIPVWTAMRAEYFGRRRFATLQGIMQFLSMPATVLGPVYAGWVFDLTKSYHIAFLSFVASLSLGVVFIYFARRPKPPVNAMPRAEQAQASVY